MPLTSQEHSKLTVARFLGGVSTRRLHQDIKQTGNAWKFSAPKEPSDFLTTKLAFVPKYQTNCSIKYPSRWYLECIQRSKEKSQNQWKYTDRR